MFRLSFFNREPVEEDLRQWDELYYVGAEAKQSGVMQGELAAEVIQKNTQIDKKQRWKDPICRIGRGGRTSRFNHPDRKCG